MAQPAPNVWYNVRALYDGRVVFEYITNLYRTNIVQEFVLSDCVDDNDVDFTVESFIEFANNSLGFGLGASSIANTGWATYVDTQYTAGSPFVVSPNTDTLLPNNAGIKNESQMPPDVVTFYDGTVITGRDGDSIDLMAYFKVKPSSQNQVLDVWVDIGGAIGELYRQTFFFPKGANVESSVMYTIPSGYTLQTWENNGARIYVNASHEIDIYRINYNIDRSHKAR